MGNLLAIDPGGVTGISLWLVPNDEPIERLDYWLVQGGYLGFADWWWRDDEEIQFDHVVCEEFIQDGRTPRVDPNALKIEGYLGAVWGYEDVIWQRNGAKTSVPDKLLKQHGYWLTGKQVGWKDGNDVNDSQRHALHWAMNNHEPSLEFYWPR